MKSFLAVLLSALALLNGQSYPCSTLVHTMDRQVGSLVCGAMPSTTQIQYFWTLASKNTVSGAITNVQHPVESLIAACGGGGSKGNCAYGYSENIGSSPSGGYSWVFIGKAPHPGGNPGFNGTPQQGWGCGFQDSQNANPVDVPKLTCPCVSSTCGQNGCPACKVCPTPNSQCVSSFFGGQHTMQQNLCAYPPNGCPTQYTLAYTGNQQPCCVNEGSPIFVDWDDSGNHLTSVENGVKFDFFGSGTPVQVAWTAPGSTNGWLVLAPGGKLPTPMTAKSMFGNLMPQPSSPDPNGFTALKQFDANGDRRIDKDDAVFQDLYLWIDANHNGVVDSGELKTMEEVGIRGFGTEYHTTDKVDQWGNQFRYAGKVFLKGGDKERIFDVILGYKSCSQ